MYNILCKPVFGNKEFIIIINIVSNSVDSNALYDDRNMCTDSTPNDSTDSLSICYLAFLQSCPLDRSVHAKLAQIDLSGPTINDIMPSDARKPFLTSSYPRVKLAKKNPSQIRKALHSLDEPVKDIQFLNSGSLFLMCSSQTQMTNLLKISQITVNSFNLPIKFSLALANQSF